MQQKCDPWIRGIVDTLVGAYLIRTSQIPTRNRLSVILIDSAFETACRSYLKHKEKIKLDQSHSHRDILVKTIKSKLPDIDASVWDNIDYYYTEIRCDFYHQSAGKTLTDVDLLDYQETVEFVINKAFGGNISQLVQDQVNLFKKPIEIDEIPRCGSIRLNSISDKKDKLLIAICSLPSANVEAVNDYFKREGDSLRLSSKEFTNIVARNSGTKNLFYFNRELNQWELSGLGKFRIEQLLKGVLNV